MLLNFKFQGLVNDGIIVEEDEVPPPTVPMDYSWARELGLIRKPASFMSSVSDERGQELMYAGVPISKGSFDHRNLFLNIFYRKVSQFE